MDSWIVNIVLVVVDADADVEQLAALILASRIHHWNIQGVLFFSPETDSIGIAIAIANRRKY